LKAWGGDQVTEATSGGPGDWLRAQCSSDVTTRIFPGVVDPRHAHPGGGATGEAQQVAATHRVAQGLGQERHLIGGDRLAHLPAQGRVGLHVGEELLNCGRTHGGGITAIKVTVCQCSPVGGQGSLRRAGSAEGVFCFGCLGGESHRRSAGCPGAPGRGVQAHRSRGLSLPSSKAAGRAEKHRVVDGASSSAPLLDIHEGQRPASTYGVMGSEQLRLGVGYYAEICEEGMFRVGQAR